VDQNVGQTWTPPLRAAVVPDRRQSPRLSVGATSCSPPSWAVRYCTATYEVSCKAIQDPSTVGSAGTGSGAGAQTPGISAASPMGLLPFACFLGSFSRAPDIEVRGTEATGPAIPSQSRLGHPWTITFVFSARISILLQKLRGLAMLRTSTKSTYSCTLDGSEGGVLHSFAHRPGLYCTAAQAFPAMEKMGGLQWQIARPEVGLAPRARTVDIQAKPNSRVHIGRVQYKFQKEILGATRYPHSLGSQS
jgi:hypothetical protein